LEDDMTRIRSKRIHSTVTGARIVLTTAVGIATAGFISFDAFGSEAGVTDYSGAQAEVIEVGDITTALAVARGTRIEPSAPPTVRLPIFFEFNSTTLRPDARELLDKVGAALASNELGSFRFSVEGHTDSVGSEGFNDQLSRDRAAAVKTYLIAQGVPAERLATMGHGESDPVAPNETDDGRQRNRRVELINLGTAE
jgi:outer membrane protein OmpA-like peptidoglycan-associated protein